MGILHDGNGIDVHIDGLRDLARQLRNESDKALGHVNRRVQSTFGAGTPFGATSQSGYVFAAKHRYDAAARRALDTLNAYALRAAALADAAEAIAAKYGDSDAFAKAEASDVHREFALALTRRQQQAAGTKPGEAA
ncbi:hypothetical protein [Actinoplanes sp. NPDC051859]|uniref:hypothetical protein n=1 Tax=Actinoplanes sp. NPDC051859 TaxID=3363909 RepID=UPI0037A5FC07